MQHANLAVVDAVFALYIPSVPRTKTARLWPICEMADRGSWASDRCGCCGIQPWLLTLAQLFFPICPWQQETKYSWCWPMVRKLCIHKNETQEGFRNTIPSFCDASGRSIITDLQVLERDYGGTSASNYCVTAKSGLPASHGVRLQWPVTHAGVLVTLTAAVCWDWLGLYLQRMWQQEFWRLKKKTQSELNM